MVKILFRFFSGVLDEWTVETLWAETVNAEKGYYKIDNIPFYAAIASGDIVFAEYEDTEGHAVYKKTIECSGNSTIQIVMLDKNIKTDTVRNMFIPLECSSEKFSEGYFVMEVLSTVNYTPVKQKLERLKNENIIDYAEPVLGENHFY